MPKRRHEESKEERWSRKMKKYELKLQDEQRKNNRRSCSSDDEDVHNQEHPMNSTNLASNDEPVCGEAVAVDESILLVPEIPNDLPEVTEITDDFDPELLKALGEIEADAVEYGEDLQADIAKRFQQILENGLKKEAKEELNKKYLFPKNVPLSKAPTLNPEIGAMLAESYKLRDKRLQNKQDQLGKALSVLGKAMTALLKKSPDISEVVRTLNDAGKLISDSHFAETDTRQSIIIPLVDKSLTESFKSRKRDGFLFGDKLGDLVKNSRGIKKTSQMIQATASTSSNLNWSRPPSQVRLQRGGAQSYQRHGGQQRPTNYPRRAPAPRPARRYGPSPPPPPPPPQRRQPAQAQAQRAPPPARPPQT